MTGSYVRKAFAACPVCGKRMYHTRKDARRIARQIPNGNDLNAYRSCGTVKNDRAGDYWHLGHLPGPVVKGDIPRDTLGPTTRRPPQ